MKDIWLFVWELRELDLAQTGYIYIYIYMAHCDYKFIVIFTMYCTKSIWGAGATFDRKLI